MNLVLYNILDETNKVSRYNKISSIIKETLEFLEKDKLFISLEKYQIRGRCLEAFQSVIETNNPKIANFAIDGLRQMLKDERMQSSKTKMINEHLDHWYPIQVLACLHSCSSFSEDLQIEVMRLLLVMPSHLPQCMTAPVIVQIIKLCFDCMNSTHKQTLINFISNTFLRLIHIFSNRIADFFNTGITESKEITETDFISIFTYLCGHLNHSVVKISFSSSLPTEVHLLLEGTLILLNSVPPSIVDDSSFTEVIWQKLTPSLISLLSIIPTDTNTSYYEYKNSSVLSSVFLCSKTIYGISIKLLQLFQFSDPTLRPVIESLFHRFLLYPQPIQRIEALKAIKPLISCENGLFLLAYASKEMRNYKANKNESKEKKNEDFRLIKMIIDCLVECNLSSDPNLVSISIEMTITYLNTLKEISKQGSVFFSGTQNKSDPTNPNRCKSGSINKSCNEKGIPSKSSKLKNQNNSQKNCLKNDMNDILTKSVKNIEVYGQYFLFKLKASLKNLMKSQSTKEADQAILFFSSEFFSNYYSFLKSSNNIKTPSNFWFLNADAVYITTYSCLKLAFLFILKTHLNFKDIEFSLVEFTQNISDSHFLISIDKKLIYVLYNFLTQQDILGLTNFFCDANELGSNVIFKLINDFEDIDKKFFFINNFDNSNSVMFKNVINKKTIIINENEIKNKKYLLAQQILSFTWNGIISILTSLINNSCNNSTNLLLLFNSKEETKRTRRNICECLEGLRITARLTSFLGLKDKCCTVFFHLASASCVVEYEEIKKEQFQKEKSFFDEEEINMQQKTEANNNKQNSFNFFSSTNSNSSSNLNFSSFRLPKIHASHVLSMDLLLGIGLEMGSIFADSWKYLFKCCYHISELEHLHFTFNSSKCSKVSSNLIKQNDSSYFFPISNNIEPKFSKINVKQQIEKSKIERSWEVTGGGILSHLEASLVLYSLSLEVDRVFEDAVSKLNLKTLIVFLEELCKSSSFQLQNDIFFSFNQQTYLFTFHLNRIYFIMNKCVYSHRPLLHILMLWNTVSNHLIQAANHKILEVSRRAIEVINDIIIGIISSNLELDHFYCNYFICKTFDKLIYLVSEVYEQDQIVSSICSLIETCPNNIKSGWKSLFGCLSIVGLNFLNEEINQNEDDKNQNLFSEDENLNNFTKNYKTTHVNTFLEVFNAFLEIDNIDVFCTAAVDFILCLLRIIRGNENQKEKKCSSICYFLKKSSLSSLNQLSQIIASLWKFSECPKFSGIERIHIKSSTEEMPNFVNMKVKKYEDFIYKDLNISHNNFYKKTKNDIIEKFEKNHSSSEVEESGKVVSKLETDHIETSKESIIIKKNNDKIFSFVDLETKNNPNKQYDNSHFVEGSQGMIFSEMNESIDLMTEKEQILSFKDFKFNKMSFSFDELESHTGLLNVYYLVLEGLTDVALNSFVGLEINVVETLFEILKTLFSCRDPNFLFYCYDNLLISSLNRKLAKNHKQQNYFSCFDSFSSPPQLELNDLNCYKQFLGLCIDLFVEIFIKYSEKESFYETLESLIFKQLTLLVELISQPDLSLSRLGCSCLRHFIFKTGHLFDEQMWNLLTMFIKSACHVTLYHLSCLMVFYSNESGNIRGDLGQVEVSEILESDQEKLSNLAFQIFWLECQFEEFKKNQLSSNNKSFFFSIFHNNICVSRIALNDIIIHLLSHQLLIQTIGNLLLDINYSKTNFKSHVIIDDYSFQRKVDLESKLKKKKNQKLISGGLLFMPTKAIMKLLSCLSESYETADLFNKKSGLKILIQKIMKVPFAANLYRISAISSTLYFNVLLEILSQCGKTLENKKVKKMFFKKNLKKQTSCEFSTPLNTIDEELKSFYNYHYKIKISKTLSFQSSSTSYFLHSLNSNDPVYQSVDLVASMLKISLNCLINSYLDLFFKKPISREIIYSKEFLLKDKNENFNLKQKFDFLTSRLLTKSPSEDGNSTSYTKVLQVEKISEGQRQNQELQTKQILPKNNWELNNKRFSLDQKFKGIFEFYKKKNNLRKFNSEENFEDLIKKNLIFEGNETSKMDLETCRNVKAEIIYSILSLLNDSDDKLYFYLLPIFEPNVVRLIANCKDSGLSSILASWVSRLSRLIN